MELTTIFILFSFVFVNADLCPKQCDCDMEQGLNRATCTDQNIVSIEVGVPKQVQIYSLSHNVIIELDNYSFKEIGYTSLVILDLSYNHIAWIGLHAFSGLNNLTNLNLSNNRLGYLPSDLFWTTPKLENLDLSGNMFDNIKNEPFLMHEKLKVLNLRNSRIKALPDRMFTRLPNLRKLDLSENYAMTMDINLLKPIKKLERMELENEYWKCTKDFMAVESWIVNKGVIYKKQCKKLTSKMFEKMISMDVNETEVDTNDVWNITNVKYNITRPKMKELTPLQKFDKEFPSIQAFILGLEIGLAIGILGAYIWLRNICKCRGFKWTRPETRRQRLRRERVAENDMNANLLWANANNPNLETPPPFRRQFSLPIVSELPTYGLHSIREASELFDVVRPGRVETPPPPYNECRVQLSS